MQHTLKAKKLRSSALKGFQKIHDQLEAACGLHQAAKDEHLVEAREAEKLANAHKSAALTAADDLADTQRIKSKLAELLPVTKS